MAQFRVTDPETGKVLMLTGDAPPTEKELENVFATHTIRDVVQRMGGTPEDATAIQSGDLSGVSDAFNALPVTDQTRELMGELKSTIARLTPTEPEPRPEGRDASQFEPLPPVDADQSPFVRATEQGLLNIGGGLLRGAGELAKLVGVDEAQQFLNDLAISQNLEARETDIVTEGAPVQRFAGEVAGETIGLPFGGSGKSLFTRLLTAMGGGATAGGLSAAGRGESGPAIAGEAALGGALGPVAEGGGAVLRARSASRRANVVGGVDADAEAIAEAAEQVTRAQQAAQATDIRLLPAQQTLDPFQLEKQAFLGQNPEVSRKAFSVLKDQNREAATAVTGLLDQIAEPGAVGVAGAEARRGASNVLNSVSLIRAERASPIYREAFEQGGNVDLTDTLSVIDDIAAGLPDKGSKIKNAVLKARTLLKGKTVDGQEVTPSLQQLHGAKLQIDEMISPGGAKGVGPTTKRYLTQVQKELVSAMREASPTYAGAMDEFRANSAAVDVLRDSLFGRLNTLKDTNLKQASRILFDAGETNPTVIRDSLKILRNVEGGDDVARGLLRTELERRLGRMKVGLTEAAQTGGRQIENVPRQLLNTLYGNDSQKRVLFAALAELDPGALKNARWLEDALGRAAEGRPGGSQTGIRNVIAQQLKGAGLAIRDFFRKPIDTLVGIGEDQRFSRKVRAVGDALYNPDWAPDMDKIRKLNPRSPEAKSQFEKLLETIIEQNELTGVVSQSVGIAGRKELTENE